MQYRNNGKDISCYNAFRFLVSSEMELPVAAAVLSFALKRGASGYGCCRILSSSS